ncbi:Yip1 family protein [Aureibacillus halotolerans]|uniref:Yip1-like protein n=1 Tax=Aureibacillus halotolerans TaxID=1508390 RepID=A0A4R6U8S0_9BACI|nr:Yip1 family protein [Aureibacillus halotolerans]TDQ41035.1 Yip1-like protein [Aureibacillus halotolerans]
MNTVKMMRQVMVHPFDFFNDIQTPNRLKWSQGVLLVFLAFIVKMASLVIVSYHFQTREPYQISYVHEFIWLFIPWLTWCVANWGVSTIAEGEGKFKEIFVGSAFCLVPYILFMIPVTLLTNVFALSEQSIYLFLKDGLLIWAGWLLLVKVKILHDFELGKLIWITVISLLGMAIIWFIGVLLYGLISQFISFLFDLVKELRFRI